MGLQHRVGRANNTGLRLLAAILLISVTLRVGLAVYLGDSIGETRGGTWDQITYDLLAQRVATGHGFSFDQDWWPYVRAGQPTAFWSYLYTLYLAGIYVVAGHHPLVARLVQAVAVGTLMPWLACRLGRRTFGERAGLLAAAGVALYFYFIDYAASLMTESFYITGILWTVDAAMRLVEALPAPKRRLARLGIELGMAMGAALLLRQLIAGFFTVLALWLLWTARRRGGAVRLVHPLLGAAACVALLCAPFIARNYRAFGQLSMPNTNVGINFFWANHPIYGTQFEAVLSPEHGVTYQELIPTELRGLSEAALDRALLVRGLQLVRDDPGRYVLLSLSRIPIYFQFWPTAKSSALSNAARLLSFGLFLPFMLYGLGLELARRRARPDGEQDMQRAYVALFLLFIVTYTTIHILSWANVRYRLPVDAFLMLFAGRAFADLWARAAQRRVQPLTVPVD